MLEVDLYYMNAVECSENVGMLHEKRRSLIEKLGEIVINQIMSISGRFGSLFNLCARFF